ncbi:MAG: 3-hydroxybutyrate dehydrogenase [Oscillochloris sp.]|nr:3-hydroxybutyrate dehydrogenase [Oscillochloris sp.]
MSEHVALVTGGASGIGRAIVERFRHDGHKVALIDRPGSQGEALAAELGALFVGADLAQRSDCRAAVETVRSRIGPIDILINNAGFQHIDAIEEFPEDTWDTMIAVMLTAPFLLTRYVWPDMKARTWGRIVNIGSIHSLRASPFKSAYISAKHGVLGLTRTAAVEGGQYGITVNLIAPAYVRTPLVENQITDQARTRGIPPEDVVEKVMLEPAAIKRLIEPAEVADLTAYLCSDAAGSMSGSVFEMALGWTAR